MWKLQRLLFVLKRPYIYHHLICMTLPLNVKLWITELNLKKKIKPKKI